MQWKGLNTGTMPVFLSYDQIERMIAALLDRATEWKPELVVGIARGGLVPGTMAAGILALPLAMVSFDRMAGTTSWIGEPPVGRRILLVDDGCSSGMTLATVRQALLQQGRECLTLTVVYDPDVSQYIPDLSHPMRSLWRFPWERGEATPTGRALRSTGAGPDRSTEQPFYGLELDGVFFSDVVRATAHADIPDAIATRELLPLNSLPFFSIERSVIITRRPESARAAILEWWAEQGRDAVPLECRPSDVPSEPASVAHYKAEAATRWGCTHFIESDPEQALRISALAPHLIVSWWSATEASGWTVGAAVSSAPR